MIVHLHEEQGRAFCLTQVWEAVPPPWPKAKMVKPLKPYTSLPDHASCDECLVRYAARMLRTSSIGGVL